MQENLRKCIICKHLFPKEEMSFYKNTKRFVCNGCNESPKKLADSFEENDPMPPDVESELFSKKEESKQDFEYTYEELIQEIKNLFAKTKDGEWSRYGIDTRPSVPTVYWVNRANVMFILFKDKPFYRRSKIIGSWIGNQIPKYKAYFEGKLNLT